MGAVATAIVMPLVGGKAAGANGAAAVADAGAAARGRGRQLMKAAVRGYVTLADRLREATAEAREQVSDLVAEVREERRIEAEATRKSGDDGAGPEAEPTASAKSRRKRGPNGTSRRR